MRNETQSKLGGSFTFPGTDLTVKRMGYGAMQLAGPHVFGEPRDRAQCVALVGDDLVVERPGEIGIRRCRCDLAGRGGLPVRRD